MLDLKPVFNVVGDVRGLEAAFTWGPWLPVNSAVRALDGNPSPELEGTAKVIEVQPELMSVEVVHRRNQLKEVEPVVATVSSHNAPVFLLDMGVIVLAVCPRPGELEARALVGEVSDAGVIDKL